MTKPAQQPAPSREDPVIRTIAVVDDDALVRESLGALLEAYGYRVRSFATGPELLAEPLPDTVCILLDIKMPNCFGLEVLDRLQQRCGPQPPVILKTGGTPQRALGALACLRKPIRPEELLAEIDRAFVGPQDPVRPPP
jgi:FixJ family two-component response regulator